MQYHALRLGAISYRLAPLYAYWRPHLKGWLIVPLLVLGTYVWFLRRTRIATSLSGRAAVLAFSLFFLAITVSVALSDGGPRAIVAPLLRTDLEYIGAIDRVQAVAQFLRDYPRLASTMPMHAQVHPPGSVLFVWAACRLFGDGPWGAAIGIILFSGLTIPLVYRWADRLGGPAVARRASAIFILIPSVVLFTATSMDGPFAVPLIATMAFYWEAMEHRPILLGSLAGIAASAAAFMTYSVTVALVFCGIATCIRYATRTAQPLTIVSSACCALASFLGTQGLMWLLTGYDPIQMFLAVVANHTHIMCGARHETPARYVHLAVANLVVFFIAVGLPCTVLWWSSMLQSLTASGQPADHQSPITDHRSPLGDQSAMSVPPPGISSERHFRCLALCTMLTLLIAASVPVYVLEVERIWMFLVPLIVIPVSGRLLAQEWGTGKFHATVVVATLTATQTLVTEVLLTTYW
jgi:4-amino-4-deoxy-L-arabinose transferase-like glycosyltransferase